MIPCDDDVAIFTPTYRYEFTPIADLASKPANATVDVAGVVTAAGPLVELISKKGTPLVKRILTISDDSNAAIEVRAWGVDSLSLHPTFTPHFSPVFLQKPLVELICKTGTPLVKRILTISDDSNAAIEVHSASSLHTSHFTETVVTPHRLQEGDAAGQADPHNLG
jgi:hypothetical protein